MRWFEFAGDARRPAFWPAWWGELWPLLVTIAICVGASLSGCDRRGRPPPPFERRVEMASLIVAIGVPTATIGVALWAWAAVRVGEIFARWMMRSLAALIAFAAVAFIYLRYFW